MRYKLAVRCLSLLMTLFLAFSLFFTPIFAAEAETDDTTTYLVFGSDRHDYGTTMTGILTTIVNTVETAEDGDIDFIGLDGDMVNKKDAYSTSTLISEIQDAGLTNAGGVNTEGADPVVGLSYGSHDVNATDDAGIMLENMTGSGIYYETDDYIIYFIGFDDMVNVSNAETAAAEFTATMAQKDSSKALFIMSHVPLHQRRGDNEGAAVWLTSINSVAKEFDTVFLWGHNHTREKQADKDVYCVTRGGEITPQGGSGAVVINFAYYVNAGYIKANEEMSIMGLTDGAITFQKYTTDGAPEDMVTVERYDQDDETVPNEITATVYANTFYVGDTFSAAGFTVVDDSNITLTYGTEYTYLLNADYAAENEDGSWTFTAAGTCTLTVKGEGDYSDLEYVTQLTVEEKTEETTSETDIDSGITVSVNGLDELIVDEQTGEDDVLTEIVVDDTAYSVIKAYNITLIVNGANYSGSAEVTFTVDLDDGTLVNLSDGSTIVDSAAAADGSVTFTVPHFSLWYLVTEYDAASEPTSDIDKSISGAAVPIVIIVIVLSMAAVVIILVVFFRNDKRKR